MPGVLTHTVATGPSDAIHHLFCTFGAPTLMMSRTEKRSHLEVDYDILMDGMGQAINYTVEPEHSFGMIFSSVRIAIFFACCTKIIYPQHFCCT